MSPIPIFFVVGSAPVNGNWMLDWLQIFRMAHRRGFKIRHLLRVGLAPRAISV